MAPTLIIQKLNELTFVKFDLETVSSGLGAKGSYEKALEPEIQYLTQPEVLVPNQVWVGLTRYWVGI